MIINPFFNMIGRTMIEVQGLKEGSDHVTFVCEDGSTFEFYHERDCCESVAIYSIDGDVSDLVWSPIVMAEAVSSDPPDDFVPSAHDSYTWTFYKFASGTGFVTVRWFGESNGYYSESVSYNEIVCPRVFSKVLDDKTNGAKVEN